MSNISQGSVASLLSCRGICVVGSKTYRKCRTSLAERAIVLEQRAVLWDDDVYLFNRSFSETRKVS